MSEIPSYAAPALGDARNRLSAAAVTSLVLGLLLCIPVFTSLLAIIFAIVGFRATRDGALRGRGFAVAGLVLGIFGLLIWVGGAGGFTSYIILGSRQPRATLHLFAAELTAGNIASAETRCDPSITAADLAGFCAKIVPYGTYTDLTCYSVNLNGSGGGGATCQLSGSAYFSSGTHPFDATLVRNAAGAWRIVGFHVF